MKNVLTILFILLVSSLFAQHHIDLYGNGTYGGKEYFSYGAETIYNYNVGKKNYIGIGGGIGLNVLTNIDIELVVAKLYERTGAQTYFYRNKNFEIPIIANVTFGSEIIRCYINGSYGFVAHGKLEDEAGLRLRNDSYSSNNRSFESGLKILLPTKKNKVLFLIAYKLNSLRFKSSIDLGPFYKSRTHHALKIGIGYNFGDVFSKQKK